MSQLPIAAQWSIAASPSSAQDPIRSVALITVPATGQKGTGWLASPRHLVTNEHVVRGFDSAGVYVTFTDGVIAVSDDVFVDARTDLALVSLRYDVKHSPLPIDTSELPLGAKICAWGHPLGYNGPVPLLTVGYLAGFNAHNPPGLASPQKRMVLNAALNSGNSGGPILAWGEPCVRGVAATKHAPIPAFLLAAIDVLAQNRSGVVYSYRDATGSERTLVESQVVAELLKYFRGMTQVVIGEAISAVDLVAFLEQRNVPWANASAS